MSFFLYPCQPRCQPPQQGGRAPAGAKGSPLQHSPHPQYLFLVLTSSTLSSSQPSTRSQRRGFGPFYWGQRSSRQGSSPPTTVSVRRAHLHWLRSRRSRKGLGGWSLASWGR